MLLRALVLVSLAWFWPGVAVAQALLVLDQEQVLNDSVPGRALLEEEARERSVLIAQARQLDRELEEEERRLTDLRAGMEAAEFRALADAFDDRVVRTRREQDARAASLTQRSEAARRAFFNQVAPILLEILEETGASAVIDQRSVLIANQSLNITAEVIKRLDARAGTGPARPNE
ncbi:MAG: OmpH family outer membrane protein [Pseudomonadota bacterium]